MLSGGPSTSTNSYMHSFVLKFAPFAGEGVLPLAARAADAVMVIGEGTRVLSFDL